MNRRRLLELGATASVLGLSGCLSGTPPELRIRNISESSQRVHVRVSRRNEELLSKSFSVPSKAAGEEQGTVEEVYSGPGTYTINAEIAGGETRTEEIELAEGSRMLTHVTIKSDETLAVGRMSP